MKRSILLALLVSLILLFTFQVVYSQVPQARFAFFHASPDTPAVDVIVNEKVVFESISYNNEAEFKDHTPGDFTITINQENTNNVILGPVKIELKEGRDHLLFMSGLISSSPELEAKLLVKKTRPAYFRFYNTSTDAGEVTIKAGDDLFFENVAYGKPTKFEKVPAGSTEILVQDSSGKVLGTSITVDFKPGKTYTIVLIGFMNGSGNQGIKIIVIEED